MISSIIESAYDVYVTDQGFDLHAYKEYLYHTFMPKGSLEVEELESMKKEDLINAVYEIAKKIYELKEESVTSERMREIERVILLQAVDSHWIDHIDAMDQLRQGIGLRAIGQQDPVVAYKLEGFDMFDNMTKAIQEDTVRYLYNFTIEEPIQRKQVVDVDKISSNVEEGQGNKPVKKEEEIGRNDECPCGSGKKYKKCCGK